MFVFPYPALIEDPGSLPLLHSVFAAPLSDSEIPGSSYPHSIGSVLGHTAGNLELFKELHPCIGAQCYPAALMLTAREYVLEMS